MDLGNEVDLSNNNITPLWKPRPANRNAPREAFKPRPLSYQTDGIHMTDFPLKDSPPRTLSQPEKTTLAGGTMVLKHKLNKPSGKSRVVRRFSFAYLSSQVKAKSEKSALDNKAHLTDGGNINGNEAAVSPDNIKSLDRQTRLSRPVTLSSQRDQIVFGTTPSSPDSPCSKQKTPANNNLNLSMSMQPQERRAPSPSLRTSCHSSTSSLPSLSSDPSTPRTPSPADRGSQTPEVQPPSPVVLSTDSPAAWKMGTQQIIPRALASNRKVSQPVSPTQIQGRILEPTRRALKALSMVENGPYFSTSIEDEEKRHDGNGSPGAFKRGLRSTSYRRAVVSGVDVDVPSMDPWVQPVLRVPKVPERSASAVNNKIRTKKGVPAQRTFDSEDDEILYQNFQEKALHNDSDEDAESREPKPDDNIVVQYKPIRTSWGQLSVVKRSGVADKLTSEQRKRQEAIFEVISSEHSYLHSLELLIRLFRNSSELSQTMTKTEQHHLFSNLMDVCEASKKFFKELEDRHQQNIVIEDISDIVMRHAKSNFDPYVTYCSNEVYQQRTLQKLLSKNPSFKEELNRIEAHSDCRGLPMISFLILPMQRATRLPLLMDTICQKTSKNTVQYEACKKALQSVSKLVRKCNEGARTMERTEMMYTINSQLEFKIKPFPLVSSSRWMVKRGELTAFAEENGLFSKKTTRHQVYFFLFNDVLIVTKKKSEESYTVIDYALRNQIRVGPCQAEDVNLSPVRTTTGILASRQGSASHLFRLHFSSNHSGDNVPMILGTEHLNERARWISALGQRTSENANADRTNMVQVEMTRTYTARQPDELSLQVADVVLVSQMVDDGE
uniref:Rho guanine nucleotide exchange factor 26 n=1 Tax=Denticeps clupeoides TaxID=299321 RepID=A0AAY4CTC2_9TELE